MSDLTAGIEAVKDALTDVVFKGNKLRLWTRLEDVKPPGILIALESLNHATGEHVIGLYLVGQQGDEYRALASLGPLLDQVTARVSPTEDTTLVSLSPTKTLRDLPALRFTTTVIPD